MKFTKIPQTNNPIHPGAYLRNHNKTQSLSHLQIVENYIKITFLTILDIKLHHNAKQTIKQHNLIIITTKLKKPQLLKHTMCIT